MRCKKAIQLLNPWTCCLNVDRGTDKREADSTDAASVGRTCLCQNPPRFQTRPTLAERQLWFRQALYLDLHCRLLSSRVRGLRWSRIVRLESNHRHFVG